MDYKIERTRWNPNIYMVTFTPVKISTSLLLAKCSELNGQFKQSGCVVNKQGKKYYTPSMATFINLESAEAFVEWIESVIVMNRLVN